LLESDHPVSGISVEDGELKISYIGQTDTTNFVLTDIIPEAVASKEGNEN